MNFNISVDSIQKVFSLFQNLILFDYKRYQYFWKLCIHIEIFFIQILSPLLPNSRTNYCLILQTIYCYIESKSTFKTSPCGMLFTRKWNKKKDSQFPVLVFAKEPMNRKSVLQQEVLQGLQQSLDPSYVPRVGWYLMPAQFVSPLMSYQKQALPRFTIENQYETDRNCVVVDDIACSFSTQTQTSLHCIDSATPAYFFATSKGATEGFILFYFFLFLFSLDRDFLKYFLLKMLQFFSMYEMNGIFHATLQESDYFFIFRFIVVKSMNLFAFSVVLL